MNAQHIILGLLVLVIIVVVVFMIAVIKSASDQWDHHHPGNDLPEHQQDINEDRQQGTQP